MGRPNIIMVLADQHNAGLLGCEGHPQVQTPVLDAFAATGTRFTECYTQNPICTPSRTCILSGQYCHNHGLYGLSGPAPTGLDNLFRHCKRHGYRTGAWGKLHVPTSPRNWIADDVDVFGDSYEMADGMIGESAYFDYLQDRGVRELEDSWHNLEHYSSRSIPLDSRPSDQAYEHTQEVWSAREGMAFMDQPSDAPWCIQVSFQKPHHPLLPVQRFWDLYPDDLDLPATTWQDPAGRPPAFRQMYENYHRQQWEFAEPGEEWAVGARRHWRGTLACVSQVDDVFGMLLRHLDERGLADNTIVVYGSDHGCYHGIHGIVEKAPGICSQEVCRVPLIWRVPGAVSGAVCDQLVENVDLTPTLVALAGLPPMDSVDGRDISSLLRGGTDPVRDVAVTENAWSKALRWRHWRYVHYQRAQYGEDVGELYDLAEDPTEAHNLYHDPASQATVAECRRLLLEWLIDTTRVTTTQPMVCETDGTHIHGRRTYPTSGDGRAPAQLQWRARPDRADNYL